MSGLPSALQILFVTVAMIPVHAIINWVFYRNATVDWKTSLVVGSSIALMWYIGVCVSTYVDIRRAVERGREFRQSFPASAFAAGIYGVSVLFSGVMSIGMYREGDPVWIQLIPLAFLLIAFYGWPRTIHCDERGIWQRSRFGLKTLIPYGDVLAVTQSQGTTTVSGTEGSIEHTQYHADAGQFQRVTAKRTGKPVRT
jgi:hypothetical protein